MLIRNLITTVLAVSALSGMSVVPEVSAVESNSGLISNQPGKVMRLTYDEPAPDSDFGWANASIPMGNGYMGVNVFGGSATERIQITENSLYDWADKNSGLKRRGVNNFAEVYIDFDHSNVSGYTRALDLNEGISTVKYEQGGVTYSREYFTSYPDKVMAIRLNASEAGKLSFTLRPTIPFIGDGKKGSVSAEGDTVTLSGVMTYYQIQFEGQFKVIPQGGKMNASKTKGTITVSDADSALILIAVGTNYQFDPQVILT
ncbi:MAG: glycoside hydrolase family 95 protein, partial [Opitutaceae bacterium]